MQDPKQLPAAWPEPGSEPPQRELTRAEIEDQLQGRHDAIKARLDAIEGEVMTTGEAIREAVVRSPWVAVGGAVAAGVVVGLMFGGRRSKRALKGRNAHHALVERYVETLVEDVRHAVSRGEDAGEAVEEALRDRTPLIVYSGREEGKSRGLIGQFVFMALQTALGFSMKAAADFLASRLDVISFEEEATVQEADPLGGETSTTVKRTVSEPAPG